MFEATLQQGAILKKVVTSIQDIVTEVNWDCNEQGIFLQSMDNSHIALVSLQLRADGFEPYRCDRNITLGINVSSLGKVLRCANDRDTITLSAADDADVISFRFEGAKGRLAEYDLKLMEINQDHLAVPDRAYDANVTMPSEELLRICRDLSTIGQNINISVNKESIRFNVEGDNGNGTVTLKQGDHTANAAADEEDELPEAKSEPRSNAMDEDDDEEIDVKPKKKAAKKRVVKVDEEGTNEVVITVDQNVNMMFSLKYLSQFAKAACLSKQVNLRFTEGVPGMIEFLMEEHGFLRYFVAPKVDDQDDDM